MITINALNTFTALEILSSLAYGEVKSQTVNHESVFAYWYIVSSSDNTNHSYCKRETTNKKKSLGEKEATS